MSVTFPAGRLDALRSLSWGGVAACIAFAAALSAWSWSGILLLPNKTLSFAEHAEYFLSLFQKNILTYFPIYLVVAIADALPVPAAARRVFLGAALVAGVLLAVQVRCAAMPDQMVYVYASTQVPYCSTFPTWRTYFDVPASVISPLAIAAMVLVFVLGRRRDTQLAAALHRTRTAQIESRRQRIEAELEAMHARVDPAVLTATLQAIRERYETSLDEGEARLDALIDELRQAARHPSLRSAHAP